jgi:hypothetical protein
MGQTVASSASSSAQCGQTLTLEVSACGPALIEASEKRVARQLSVGTALSLAIWAYHTTGWFGALWALGFAIWNAAALTKNQV